MPHRFSAVVPAAGASSRFGSMKLLADIGGRALLDRTLSSLLDAGADRISVVVTAAHELGALPVLADARVTLVTNPDPSRGMFSSIQTGIDALSAGVLSNGVVLILPGDMPFVPAGVVSRVAATCADADEVVVPVYGGKRGHPIAIPSRYRAGLVAMASDATLKDALRILSGRGPHELHVDARGVLRDVDVPGDLAES